MKAGIMGQGTQTPAGANFWRVFIYAPVDVSEAITQVNEVEMMTTVGGSTVCVGGIPFASTEYGAGALPQYSASAAFDGAGDGWATQGNQHLNCFIGYYFDSPVEIKEFALTPVASLEGRCAARFKLQYSYDGSQYFDATDTYAVKQWGDSERKSFTVPNKHLLSNVTARYLRVANIASYHPDANNHAAIHGLRVLDAVGNDLTDGLLFTNWSASSELQLITGYPYSAYHASTHQSASFYTDSWISAGIKADPYPYLQVDLGQLVTFNRIELMMSVMTAGWSVYAPLGFDIQVSNDGVQWVTVRNVTGCPETNRDVGGNQRGWTAGEIRSYLLMPNVALQDELVFTAMGSQAIDQTGKHTLSLTRPSEGIIGYDRPSFTPAFVGSYPPNTSDYRRCMATWGEANSLLTSYGYQTELTNAFEIHGDFILRCVSYLEGTYASPLMLADTNGNPLLGIAPTGLFLGGEINSVVSFPEHTWLDIQLVCRNKVLYIYSDGILISQLNLSSSLFPLLGQRAYISGNYGAVAYASLSK